MCFIMQGRKWGKLRINKSPSNIGIYASMIRLIEELSLMGYGYSFDVVVDMAIESVLCNHRSLEERVAKNNGGATPKQLSRIKSLTFMRSISSLDMVYSPTTSIPNIPTMAELKGFLSDAIKRVNDDYKVEIFRDYNNGKPAGFNIKHSKSPDLNFKVNISLHKRTFKSYCEHTPFNNIMFRCEEPTSLALEKISALSGDTSIIKAKDLLDLYQLSQLGCYRTKDFVILLSVCDFNLSPLGNFSIFKKHKGTLKSAYEKLEINPIDNSVQKPPFEEVYNRVSRFIELFMSGEYKENNYYWKPIDVKWEKW